MKWNEFIVGVLLGFIIIQNWLGFFPSYGKVLADFAGLYILWIFIDLKQTQ